MHSCPSACSAGINFPKHDPSAQSPCAKTMPGLVEALLILTPLLWRVGLLFAALAGMPAVKPNPTAPARTPRLEGSNRSVTFGLATRDGLIVSPLKVSWPKIEQRSFALFADSARFCRADHFLTLFAMRGLPLNFTFRSALDKYAEHSYRLLPLRSFAP